MAEFITAMGIMTVVMGATMGGLAEIVKGNDTVLQMTGMNNSLRAGMDLIVRDLLQVGSGLPPGHTSSPSRAAPGRSGSGFPGLPSSTFLTPSAPTTIAAVIPRPAGSDLVDGVATDDAHRDDGRQHVPQRRDDRDRRGRHRDRAGLDLAAGADRVSPGQLMLVMKGGLSILLEVTGVNLEHPAC